MHEGNSLLYPCLSSTSVLMKIQQELSWLSWIDGAALQRQHLQKGQWQLTHFIHLKVQHFSLI